MQYTAKRFTPLWPRLADAARICLWTLVCTVCAAPGQAAAPDPGQDTLLRLAQTGRIVLGARDKARPVSFADGSGAHVGYQMEICLRVVAAIRQRFDLPSLKVVTVPTTSATRFALLNNRTVDIECGDNAVNAGAMQQALLSHATLITDVQLMVRTPQAQLSFAGLSGRPVGVIVGSTAIPALRALSRDSRLKVLEVPGRDDADIFALLEQGRVEAIAGSSLVLATLRALAVEPQAYAILPPVLRSDPLALMFRLEDEPLHALANEVVAAMMRSGEMERIHRKWFQQPPPTALQRLFDSPGSEAGAL